MEPSFSACGALPASGRASFAILARLPGRLGRQSSRRLPLAIRRAFLTGRRSLAGKAVADYGQLRASCSRLPPPVGRPVPRLEARHAYAGALPMARFGHCGGHSGGLHLWAGWAAASGGFGLRPPRDEPAWAPLPIPRIAGRRGCHARATPPPLAGPKLRICMPRRSGGWTIFAGARFSALPPAHAAPLCRVCRLASRLPWRARPHYLSRRAAACGRPSATGRVAVAGTWAGLQQGPRPKVWPRGRPQPGTDWNRAAPERLLRRPRRRRPAALLRGPPPCTPRSLRLRRFSSGHRLRGMRSPPRGPRRPIAAAIPREPAAQHRGAHPAAGLFPRARRRETPAQDAHSPAAGIRVQGRLDGQGRALRPAEDWAPSAVRRA